MRFVIVLFALFTLLSFQGCKKKKEIDLYEPPLTLITDPRLMPNFFDDFDKVSLLKSIDNSIKYLKTRKVNFRMQSGQFSQEEVLSSLIVFRELLETTRSHEEFDKLIKQKFDVYISRGDGDGKVLYTGYFQPIFDGSYTKTSRFQYPIYKRPAELVKGQPYYSKAEIDINGVLRGKNLELVYVESYLAAHIIHVQGTAIIRLPTGKEISIGYHGDNGKGYTSVIKELINDGYISKDNISLDTLENFFKAKPDFEKRYLSKNERYIFFKEIIGGPYGSLGMEVTPRRSLATHSFQKDEYLFPPCGIAFVDCQLPMVDGTRMTYSHSNFFAINQDTGSAITGRGRADIYFGVGDKAKIYAGYTHTKGKLYYLKLKR